jgi:hypothetical protein
MMTEAIIAIIAMWVGYLIGNRVGEAAARIREMKAATKSNGADMTDPINAPPTRIGLHSNFPLPTTDWPKDRGDPPKYWWGIDEYDQLIRVYRDEEEHSDD